MTEGPALQHSDPQPSLPSLSPVLFSVEHLWLLAKVFLVFRCFHGMGHIGTVKDIAKGKRTQVWPLTYFCQLRWVL